MSSVRKTAANRSNAACSTGPRSPMGKARASRNALRHGLSVNVRYDPVLSEEAERLAHAIAGQNADIERLAFAKRAAEAELDLRRVRTYRAALINTELATVASDIASNAGKHEQGDQTDSTRQTGAFVQCLERLSSLERYERRAFSRRKRVFREFQRRYPQC